MILVLLGDYLREEGSFEMGVCTLVSTAKYMYYLQTLEYYYVFSLFDAIKFVYINMNTLF